MFIWMTLPLVKILKLAKRNSVIPVKMMSKVEAVLQKKKPRMCRYFERERFSGDYQHFFLQSTVSKDSIFRRQELIWEQLCILLNRTNVIDVTSFSFDLAEFNFRMINERHASLTSL